MNLITKQHDFNRPIRFSRSGFYAFCQEKDLQAIVANFECNVEGLRDFAGNIYVFETFPNALPEELYAQLLPALSRVFIETKVEKKL